MSWLDLLNDLESGHVRAATQDEHGQWHANVDVKKGIINPNINDIGPLKHFDVVFVNRKRIADQNLFVQQFIRNALPIDFSLYYDLQDRNSNN